MVQVVGVAVGGWAVAALDHAAAVAQRERAAQPRRDQPGTATQVQHLRGRSTQGHRQHAHRLPQPDGQQTILAATVVVAAGAGISVATRGRVAVHDRPGQGGVARQPPHRLRWQRRTPLTHPTNTPPTIGGGQ
jgi:acyl-coenzyme A thioesterase PaaI-like protein